MTKKVVQNQKQNKKPHTISEQLVKPAFVKMGKSCMNI